MKLIKQIIYVLVGVCCLTACETMDQYPQDKLTPTTYFSSAEELQLYTNYFYKIMPDPGDNMTWYMEEGEHFVSHSPGKEFLGTRNVEAQADNVGWTWTTLRKINYFLQHSDQCDDEDARNHYNGIAYFFRAYFYYDKLIRFGDVPWYDQPIESDNDVLLAKARDSRDVIVNHIIADLDTAVALLPAAPTPYEVNKWTALALKSRLCLFEATFRKYHNGDVFNPNNLPWDELLQKGAAASLTLMSEGNYSLYKEGTEPYRDLFASIDARSCEMIWARRFVSELGIKNNANGWSTQRYTGFTKRFANSYLMKDGTRFTDRTGYDTLEYVEEFKNRDPRMAQTIYAPGYIQKGQTTSSAVSLDKTYTGYKYIKYVMEVTYNTWGASVVSLPIFRLGEVYLNYAECLAELGTLTQNDLDISVNLLRDRVGMPHISLADANAYPDPYLKDETTGWPHVDKGSNMGILLELRRERTIELCLEGLHYWDIIRWKEGKLFEKPLYGVYFPGEGKYDLTGNGKANACLYTTTKPGGLGLTFLKIGTDIILSNDTYGNMWAHSTMHPSWTENKDYLYAIPTNERVLTGGVLTQNPGWDDGLTY